MTLPAPFRPPRLLAGASFLLAFACSLPADAMRLGEATVLSARGQPLDATFALVAESGETPAPECFRLGSARATRLLLQSRATFAIDSTGPVPRLRLRTAEPITEELLQVRLSAACPGGRATTRDYVLAIEPRVAVTPATIPATAIASPAPSPAPAPAPSPLPTAASSGMGTLPGDTLLSLASAIYPRNPPARDAYVDALRNQNPAVAGLGAEEPIAPGTVLVLPDLRKFSLDLAMRRSAPPARRPETVAPRPARVAETAPRPASPGPARPTPATVPASRGPSFSLRLSGPELDLTRSRGVDERQRAQLRARLLAMEADDKVAALLALKHSLSRLEGRVAELQLQLSALPSAPVPTVTAAAPAVTAAAPAKQPAPAPAPTAAPEMAKGAEKAPATPPPPVAPAKPAVSPPPPPPPKAAKSATAPAPARAAEPAQTDLLTTLPAWLWGVLAALVAGAAILGGLWMRRRKTREAAAPQPHQEPEPEPVSDLEEAEALMRGDDRVEPLLLHADEGRAVAESDAGLATRVGGTDPAFLRRRYLEERFPEIAVGTIVLEDPDSVVKAARLFYEDGALPRAVELLQFAVEDHPEAMKPWLALFEIFRLEGLAGEFGALAERFREHHGRSENWRKVQFIGREIDPQNPLYHDAPQAHLETIVPLSAAAAPVTFDPMAENWLNAPMDFTGAALAATLRTALLADAGVQEEDLAQDPMPALKSVEMFHVA